eukprot:m.26962 g.26962  ORF g.26962 m.26962 type:complete len:396 (-) comp15620_c0_seq1:150-1337(-)
MMAMHSRLGFGLLIATLMACLVDGEYLGSWHTVASMGTSRSGHALVSLGNGRVLACGGRQGADTYLASAELYDSRTDKWKPVANMLTPRAAHGAAFIENGFVMIAGGYDGVSKLSSAEVYDARLDSWTAVRPMTTGQAYLQMAQFGDGTGRILAGGGIADHNSTLRVAAEGYDPITQHWLPVANMSAIRDEHYSSFSMAFMPTKSSTTGKVLTAGGDLGGPNASESVEVVAWTQVYDAVADSWQTAANMTVARNNFGLTAIDSNAMIAVGGGNANGSALLSAEVYHHKDNTWVLVADMQRQRFLAGVAPLGNNSVLVTGGSDGRNLTTATAEIFYFSGKHTSIWQWEGHVYMYVLAAGSAVIFLVLLYIFIRKRNHYNRTLEESKGLLTLNMNIG